MRFRIIALVVAAATAACSSGQALEPATDVDYYRIDDAEPLRYDLVAGERSEVAVVVLHGFDDRARGAMEEWVDVLAAEDVVVLNGDWMPSGSTQQPPSAEGALAVPSAVACLVDTARAVTGRERVVLVGVSAGGYQAVLAGATWGELDRDGCDAAPTGPPDVIVALAGAFDAARRGPLAAALSGSPDALARLDVFEQLTSDDEPVRLVVVHGDADPVIPPAVADEFAAVAEQAGWTVDVHRVAGGEHFPFGSPTTPDGMEARAIIDEILSGTSDGS